MMRSLAFKWIATLLLTSLIGVALVGVFAYRATLTEFDRLRAEQAEAGFVADMTAYYEANGSWDGLREPPGEDRPERGAPGYQGQGGYQPREFFALVDRDGTVIFGHGRYEPGDVLSAQELASGTPILVDDQQVGTALMAQSPPELDPREQRYIDSTNQALLFGAVGAAAAALLVGILLSRGFLRQVNELHGAMGAMRTGDLKQQVKVYSQDELGDLAAAFNRMSDDLHRANDLRQQMTADIAHELRTPLTVISGYVEGLTDGTFKPTPTRFEAIQTEVTLLRRLVEDLRTQSLADAGELKLVRSWLAPQELLEVTKKAFETLADKSDVRLIVKSEGNPPMLPIDRERMLQVLTNLTSNALRHTPAGGSVTLEAHTNGQHVEIRVKDSGAGIPAEHLPNIFERFYRADVARDTEGGGSGLGLAIARSIVEAHGGTIGASSAEEEGTTMTIRLPLKSSAGWAVETQRTP
jgi:signal transduction histidine kinase